MTPSTVREIHVLYNLIVIAMLAQSLHRHRLEFRVTMPCCNHCFHPFRKITELFIIDISRTARRSDENPC